MNDKPLIQRIQDLIDDGRLDDACKVLLLTWKEPNEIRQYSARLKELEKQIRQGTIGQEFALLEKNRIRISLFDLLKEMENMPVSPDIQAEIEKILVTKGRTTPRHSIPAKYILLSLAGICLAAVLSFRYLSDVWNGTSVPKQEQYETGITGSATDQGIVADPVLKDRKETKPRPSPTSEPLSERIQLSTFADIGQQADIAFFNSGNLPLPSIREAVQDKFIGDGKSTSGTFFRPAFYDKFGQQLANLDFAALRAMGMQEHIHCICQIQIETNVKDTEMEGIRMYTASGRVEVYLFNLVTGKTNIVDIGRYLKGAGMSEEGALASFEEKILKSGRIGALNTSACQ